jgi:hypothetical protein
MVGCRRDVEIDIADDDDAAQMTARKPLCGRGARRNERSRRGRRRGRGRGRPPPSAECRSDGIGSNTALRPGASGSWFCGGRLASPSVPGGAPVCRAPARARRGFLDRMGVVRLPSAPARNAAMRVLLKLTPRRCPHEVEEATLPGRRGIVVVVVLVVFVRRSRSFLLASSSSLFGICRVPEYSLSPDPTPLLFPVPSLAPARSSLCFLCRQQQQQQQQRRRRHGMGRGPPL